MSQALFRADLHEGEVATCGMRFQDEASCSDVRPELLRLAEAYPHLVRQAPDGVWWIGTSVCEHPRTGEMLPFPEQEQRMRTFVSQLPAALRGHPAAWSFGVWLVQGE